MIDFIGEREENMDTVCNYCINKESCKNCNKAWKDMFIPSEEVKKYFQKSYNGVKGINGYSYHFDTTNDSLVPTHHIIINGDYFCPYCGEEMYPIQDKYTFAVIGYCCICEGAKAEIEYERKKNDLEAAYKKKISNLQAEYDDKLSFCSEKLFEIKQKRERNKFNFFSHDFNHFSTLNGKLYTEIEQIVG